MLISNWKEITTKAYSMRLMFFAAVFSGLEVVLPYMNITWIQVNFVLISFIVTVGAMIARLLVQKDLSDDVVSKPP